MGIFQVITYGYVSLPDHLQIVYLPSLKLTASLPLKIDGWNVIRLPFGALLRPIFRGLSC